MTLTQGAVPQWRDISTAPKDGTVFLAFRPHSQVGFMFVCCVGTDGSFRDNLRGEQHHPTHWMRLPDYPEQP